MMAHLSSSTSDKNLWCRRLFSPHSRHASFSATYTVYSNLYCGLLDCDTVEFGRWTRACPRNTECPRRNV